MTAHQDPPPPPPEDQDQVDGVGLECPDCGCRHLPVYYTRRRRRHILRVRYCRNCGRRIVTRER